MGVVKARGEMVARKVIIIHDFVQGILRDWYMQHIEGTIIVAFKLCVLFKQDNIRCSAVLDLCITFNYGNQQENLLTTIIFSRASFIGRNSGRT